MHLQRIAQQESHSFQPFKHQTKTTASNPPPQSFTMHSLYSLLAVTLLTAQTALAATNIGCYSGIAGWRRNDVEKFYYQDAQGRIFQQTLDPNGGSAGNPSGPLPLGNYPAIFSSPLAVVQFANAQEVRLPFSFAFFANPTSKSQKCPRKGNGEEARGEKHNK